MRFKSLIFVAALAACTRSGDQSKPQSPEAAARSPEEQANAPSSENAQAAPATTPASAALGAANNSPGGDARPMNIGINLDQIAYYMAYMPYADLASAMCGNEESTCWEPAQGGGKVAVDGDNYPTAPGKTSSWMVDPGKYDVTWEGTGSVSFDGGKFTPTSKSSGTLDMSDSRVMMTVNPPVHNLRVLGPAGKFEPGHVFRKDFLKRMQPFSTIRFMDPMRTNASKVSKWSDRTWPTSFSHARPAGIAYEAIAALANEAKRDVWINIPLMATDDYVCRFARLLRYGEPGDRQDAPCDPKAPGSPVGAGGINPPQRVWVEYSNELWNWGFQQTTDLYCMANGKSPKPIHTCQLTEARSNVMKAELASSKLPWSNNPYYKANQLAAETTVRFGEIFRTVFHDHPDQIRVVVGAQAAWSDGLTPMLDFVQAVHGDAHKVLDAVAIAPYFDVDEKADVNGLTMDALFAALDQTLAKTIPSWIDQAKKQARFGIPLVAYEGGQGLAGDKNRQVKEAAQDDPRMYQAYKRYFALWGEKVGRDHLFMHYSFATGRGSYGSWGAFVKSSEQGTQKWDALMTLTRPPGDANLDGHVDIGDCTLVKANMGLSAGAWWEKGDFNHDGKVDAADLAVVSAAVPTCGR